MVKCGAMQNSAILYCVAVRYSTMEYFIALYTATLYFTGPYSRAAKQIAVQCSAVQCNTVQCSAVQCSAVQCSAVRAVGSNQSSVLHSLLVLTMMFLNPIFEGRTMCSNPYTEPVRSTCRGKEKGRERGGGRWRQKGEK